MAVEYNTLQSIYDEKSPYTEMDSFSNSIVVVFKDEFIDKVLIAFDTNCVATMSESEKSFLLRFAEYEDGDFEDSAAETLDIYLSNMVNGIPNIKNEDCL